MNTLVQCEHIKNMPQGVVFQHIGWEVDGIQYAVCEECYRSLLIKKAEEQYK